MTVLYLQENISIFSIMLNKSKRNQHMWQKKVCGPDWVWSGDILEVENDGRLASSVYTVLAACLVCGQIKGCLRMSQDVFQRRDMIIASVTGPM